jgi:hypothetical protein
MNAKSTGGITLKGENKVLGEKPVPVSLCPPQILHDSPDLNQHDLIQIVVISKNAEHVSLKFSPGDSCLTYISQKN